MTKRQPSKPKARGERPAHVRRAHAAQRPDLAGGVGHRLAVKTQDLRLEDNPIGNHGGQRRPVLSRNVVEVHVNLPKNQGRRASRTETRRPNGPAGFIRSYSMTPCFPSQARECKDASLSLPYDKYASMSSERSSNNTQST